MKSRGVRLILNRWQSWGNREFQMRRMRRTRTQQVPGKTLNLVKRWSLRPTEAWSSRSWICQETRCFSSTILECCVMSGQGRTLLEEVFFRCGELRFKSLRWLHSFSVNDFQVLEGRKHSLHHSLVSEVRLWAPALTAGGEQVWDRASSSHHKMTPHNRLSNRNLQESSFLLSWETLKACLGRTLKELLLVVIDSS